MRVNWGISADDIDNFERNQYTPYDGPIPPNNVVFKFKIKILRFTPATGDKHPQLRIGLELVPRNSDDKKFAGYFIMLYRHITERSQFVYVPFLDALGITGKDFINRTIADEEGNIKTIGKWRNTGSEHVMCMLKDDKGSDGIMRKDVAWFGPLKETDEAPEDDDIEEYDDEPDDDFDDDDDDDDFGDDTAYADDDDDEDW
jgi:hypothetical protein